MKSVKEAAKDLKLGSGISTAWIWPFGLLLGTGALFFLLWHRVGGLVPIYDLFYRSFQNAKEMFGYNYAELYRFFRYWLG